MIPNQYDGDDDFWQEVYKTNCEVMGKKFTPKKDLKKWYEHLYSDSAVYRMYGNGIALTCAEFIVGRIAIELRKAEKEG